MARRSAVKLTPLRRHLAAVVTIALSCAFVAVMVLAGNLMQASLRSQVAQQLEGADLEIHRPMTDEQWMSEGPLDAPQVEGTDAVWPQLSQYLELTSADGESTFLSLSLLPPGETDPGSLREGMLPSSSSEIVLDTAAADQLGASLGDTVTVPADWSPSGQELPLTVVGIAPAPAGAVFGGPPRVLIAEAGVADLLGPSAGTMTETWLATVPEGADPAAVASAVTSDSVVVRTVQEAEEEAAGNFLGDFAALGMLLAVFVVIALFTSAVVIANTFAVTIAQRTRSLALLRTLGATRSQVRAVVLRESLAVGLIGAAAGMVGGHLLVQVALAGAAGIGWLDGIMFVPFSLWSILLPLLAGVAITLLASLAPMRSATRVAPLQALRPIPPVARRGLGLRGVLGLTALVLGIAVMAGGTALALGGQATVGILLAMLGGVVSFTGILISLVVLTRPLSAAVGRLIGRFGGLPARIASANVARNPQRSAATIAALLIGTTLMTMMAVGARTAEATLISELDSRRPIDMVISAGEMPADGLEQILAVDGIDTAFEGHRGDIQVGVPESMTLYAITPEAVRETSHRPEIADELVDGVVLLGQERSERFGVTEGQLLEVAGADGATHELRVQIDANLQMSFVTPGTLEELVGDQSTSVIFADFADPGTPQREGVNSLDLVGAVDQVIVSDGFSEASADFGGMERESYGQILAILLGITVGLLAVAVLVALVGVANTLSLGVIERTGENALLRALGTTKRQMRAMLGWEGVLLALVGAVLGIVIGSAYGVLGINALLGPIYPVTMTIPWGQLGLVLLLAVIAGGLASVLPGRTAARTAPAAALADNQ